MALDKCQLLFVAIVASSVSIGCASSSDADNKHEGSARSSVAPSSEHSNGPAAPVGPVGAPADSFPDPARAVATIVAPRWTNEDARDNAGEFARVVSLAGIKPGMTVADIGAGDGYYVVRLSPMVGASGKVLAEDIVNDYLRMLGERVKRDRLGNVQIVRGEAHDPRLPVGALDVALMVHMYHEIDQPFGLLYNLAPSLKSTGKLAILELDRPTFGHGTPPALLRCELEASGYREIAFLRPGGEEYVAIFSPPPPESRPTPAALRSKLDSLPCRPPAE